MISTSTNAEKQKHYRKQRKLESDTFLEKERKRQKAHMSKHPDLLKRIERSKASSKGTNTTIRCPEK